MARVALGWVREEGKRADIKKSIMEMRKGLEMKMSKAYSRHVQSNGFVKMKSSYGID